MRVYLDNIGCRLNWSEIEMLARQFVAAGHPVVATPLEADVILVNTCAVTAQAERKTRHQLRSLHRENPDAQIAVLGCFPTLRSEVSRDFPGVAWVIPNADKARTVNLLTAEPLSPLLWQEPPEEAEMLRTRAFVKVQDGCDNHCTYCIIPSLRGPSRSRPLSSIVAEVQTLVEDADCQEAVLTGASLGAYGRDLGPDVSLRRLVETLLAESDVGRLRISSLEPWDIDETFFELWEDPRLCRQIHLPLQSGCDATLRRMGRPIALEEFARLVRAGRDNIPGLAVTTDILVGFPGEDEVAFRQSYAFVEQLAFAKLHVFPYSSRPGTPATKLSHQVPRHVRDERARQMRELGAEQRRRFKERFLGRDLDVLWEKRRRDGRWTGWTDNYIRVVARKEADLFNKITPARLVTLENGHVKGEALG
jgi:threonylcarbamoyladenosine tRNA methylthiotransferase MtaB